MGLKDLILWRRHRLITPEIIGLLKPPEKMAEMLRAAAEVADEAARLAVYGGRGSEHLWEAADRLEYMADKIEQVNMLQDIYLDGEAILGMISALRRLDALTIRHDPERAAREFGRMFRHASRLARFIPGAGRAYADFLQRIDEKFLLAIRQQTSHEGIPGSSRRRGSDISERELHKEDPMLGTHKMGDYYRD